MTNQSYIGELVNPSENEASGVLSLRQHFNLKQANLLDEKLPALPTSSNTVINFPTTNTNLAATIGTFTGVEASYIDPDGNYLFTCTGTNIYRYDFDIPFEFKSLSTSNSQNLSLGFEAAIGGIFFKPDGSKLFVVGGTNDDIKEFNLNTPWDLTTLTFTGVTLDINLTNVWKEATPRSLYFSPDGTKIIISAGSKNVWVQINLGTAWDLTTASTYIKEKNLLVASGGIYGHSFSANGEYVFLVDNTSDNIHKYELDTPWDITSIKTNQFYFGGIEASPAGSTFNNDGTKFYFTGTSTDDVYELELSTPYDINTATFNANHVTYYIARNSTAVTSYSFWFKSDGTKLYVLDTSDRITQFGLTTAWDPKTIKYETQFSVAGEEDDPRDFFFKPDGTRLYVIGPTGDDVNEYSLSTAWDISTADYQERFSISAQELTPRSVHFSNDGTKMFVMGATGDDVNEYALSTAWDISTASYTTVFSLLATGVTITDPQSLTFNGDGTAFYVINAVATSNGIVKYSLGTAWDLSTASYDSSEFFASGFDSATARIRFNGDGTKLLFLNEAGTRNESVVSIPLTTPYNINTAQYNIGGTFGNETVPTGIHWGNNGNFLYVVGSTGDAVDQFEALVPYKISTIRFLRTRSVSAQETVPQSVYFNTDGTKMFVIGSTGDDVNEYSLSTAWNISTTSFTRLFSVAAQTTLPAGFAFNADGTKMFVLGQNNNTIFEYALGTGWDLSTASYTNNSLLITFFEVTGTGFAFNGDGTKLYFLGTNQDAVNQIELASAYTLTPKNIFYVGNKDITPYSVTFKPDGTKMYVIGTTSDSVHEYDLSVAWDISTSTFLQTFSVGGQETAPFELRFKPDGTKMFVLGITGDDINEYALSTAWDVSSATFSHSFSINAQETTPSGLFFKSDGTKMYVLGYTNDQVHQYTLSTAWDVSSASYDSVSFSVLTETTNPYGLTFKPDGTELYIIDNTLKRFLIYPLDTAWDLSSVINGRVTPNSGTVYHFSMSTDGNTAYGTTYTSTTVAEIEFYELSVPYSLVGAQYVNSYNLGSRNDNVTVIPTNKYFFSHNRTDSTARLYSTPNKGGTANVVSYSSATNDLVDQSITLSGAESTIRAFCLDATGTRLYTTGPNSNKVFYYTLSPAWDITSASLNTSLDLASYAVSPVGIRVTPDGKTLLIYCSSRQQIFKYEMTTAFDLSTAVFVKRCKPIIVQKRDSLQDFAPRNAYFSPDGRLIYLISQVDYDTVLQFNLSEDHEVIKDSNRISFDYRDFRTSIALRTRTAFNFSDDGEYLYALVPGSYIIEQWKLKNPFNVNEDMLLQYDLDISAEETTPTNFRFGNKGSKLYVVGQTGQDVTEYTLSTPWMLNSTSFSSNVSITAATTTPVGIEFDDTGTNMYILGDTERSVFQYELSTPWDTSSIIFDSVAFDGAGDYLRCDAALDAHASTSQSFTIECWVYPKTVSSTTYFIGFNTASAGANELVIGLRAFILNNTSRDLSIPINASEWTHVAVTYDGTSVKIYINGVLSNTVNGVIGPLADCVGGIGAEFDAANGGTPGNYLNGYISNFRVVVDSVVYTENFTPPTAALTAITGTTLLTCRGSTIQDESTNNFTVTTFGQAAPARPSPFFESGENLDVSSNFYLIEQAALTGVRDMVFNETGTQLIVSAIADIDLDVSVFFIYNLSTPWNLSTATYLDYIEYSERHETRNVSNDHYAYMAFANKGRLFYLCNGPGYSITGHTLRTSYDIKTFFNGVYGYLNNTLVPDTVNHYISLSEDGKLLLFNAARASTAYRFNIIAHRLTTPFDLNTVVDENNLIEPAIVSQPLYSFMDTSGQYLFYSIASTIRRVNLSGVNPT